MNIKSLIQLYLAELRAAGSSENTVEDYLVKLRKFCVYLSIIQDDRPCSVEDITLETLFSYVEWLRTKNQSSITVQSYVRALRVFLNWLYRCGYIDIDYCSRFRLPKARKPYINVLTDDECMRLYECYPDGSNSIHLRNRVIISLMLDCGLRLDEVVTAERAKLHLTDHYLIVTGKGNKQRAVSFGNSTYHQIKTYLCSSPGTSPALLLQVDGSPITRDTIKNMFRKLKKKSGVERLYPHLLRHTFATRFLENGGNIYDLKDLLGHTTLKQVQTYLHISNTRIFKGYEQYSPLDNIKKAPL